MEIRFKFLPILMLLTAFAVTACGGTTSTTTGGGGGASAVTYTFASATTPGNAVSVTAASATFKMIYANNLTSITFPFTWDDTAAGATLTKKFFMGETTVTNALFAEVLQWAKDNNKFSSTSTDSNGLDATTAKFGAQELIDLNGADMKIIYTPGTGKFTVTSGYENYPVVLVTWYGAIMFCNWLTEMEDGNTTNCVYNEPDATWDHIETTETASKTGYRLPSNEEWEYAARYLGKTTPAVSTGDNSMLNVEYIKRNFHGGNNSLTDLYCWTPGLYASGAIHDNINELGDSHGYDACDSVAWFGNSTTSPTGNATTLKPVAGKAKNKLGLYDMSGNVFQWCYTIFGSNDRIRRGGSFNYSSSFLRIGYNNSSVPYNYPEVKQNYIGFRLAKTQ